MKLPNKMKKKKSYVRAFRKAKMHVLHKEYMEYCHILTCRKQVPLAYRDWLHMPQARI